MKSGGGGGGGGGAAAAPADDGAAGREAAAKEAAAKEAAAREAAAREAERKRKAAADDAERRQEEVACPLLLLAAEGAGHVLPRVMLRRNAAVRKQKLQKPVQKQRQHVNRPLLLPNPRQRHRLPSQATRWRWAVGTALLHPAFVTSLTRRCFAGTAHRWHL